MRKENDFSGARRGAVITQAGKTRIMIYVDDDVLQTLRERADAGRSGIPDDDQ